LLRPPRCRPRSSSSPLSSSSLCSRAPCN
jgi:hypothetical protein